MAINATSICIRGKTYSVKIKFNQTIALRTLLKKTLESQFQLKMRAFDTSKSQQKRGVCLFIISLI
jgi:hypothetical protein